MAFLGTIWQGICMKSGNFSKWLGTAVDICAMASLSGSHISGDSALLPFHFPVMLDEVSAFGDDWLERDSDSYDGFEQHAHCQAKAVAKKASVITVEPKRGAVAANAILFPMMLTPLDESFDYLSDVSLENVSLGRINYGEDDSDGAAAGDFANDHRHGDNDE